MPRSPEPLAGGPRAGPAPQLLRRPVTAEWRRYTADVALTLQITRKHRTWPSRHGEEARDGPRMIVREAPTLGELAEATAYRRLPPQEAARLLAGAQSVPAGPRPDPGTAPPPRYTSFAAWLTDAAHRRRAVEGADRHRPRSPVRPRAVRGPLRVNRRAAGSLRAGPGPDGSLNLDAELAWMTQAIAAELRVDR